MKRGNRVELTDAVGYRKFGLAAGDHGTVEFIDSLSTVHIRWDSGQRIGILAQDADHIRVSPDSVRNLTTSTRSAE